MPAVVEYGIIIAALALLIGVLGPLSAASVALADMLALAPQSNRVLAVMLVFVGFSLCYRQVRQRREISTREGLKAYVLIAIGMAGVYYLVYVSHSGCYFFGGSANANPSILDFVYFSFVTVTTLGYGDIVPNHTFVRMLVVMQILFGAFLILRSTADASPGDYPQQKRI